MDAYSSTIIDAVAKVKTAVVKIETYKQQDNKQTPAGTGSGFLFSSDGYLFTNSHVVNNASKIQVKLHDGSQYPAELIGQDADTDLAILKISALEFKPAALGDSTHSNSRSSECVGSFTSFTVWSHDGWNDPDRCST
jgi:S1-C subfamily serine protease